MTMVLLVAMASLIGVLEYWSSGVLQKAKDPIELVPSLLHCSITPLLRHRHAGLNRLCATLGKPLNLLIQKFPLPGTVR